MSDRQRLIEIEVELQALSQKRRELLAERQRLTGVRIRSTVAQVWVDSIFTIIEAHPGISRHAIVIEFGNPNMTELDLTNCLTTLRRRGWIENHGTWKNPEWHSRGRISRDRWHTRESRTS